MLIPGFQWLIISLRRMAATEADDHWVAEKAGWLMVAVAKDAAVEPW